jgi:hypothetical protein
MREEVSELQCPHRRRRRQKIRNIAKRIRIYRNVRESIEYHPVLISMMLLMYRLQ